MKANKTKVLIFSLVLVIVLLLLVIAYTFVVRPAISGHIIQAQNQGVQLAFLSIMQQAAKCQSVPLTYGNQTINIVAVKCLPPELFQKTPEGQTSTK